MLRRLQAGAGEGRTEHRAAGRWG